MNMLKLDTLPHTPGIYKFLDKDENILYIGKAIDLNKRVWSYFKDDLDQRPRIRQMMPMVADVEVIETNNEIEALVLESALIKDIKPKFNTDLKDDKSYAWIYISTSDKFPTVKIVRSLKKGEYKKGELFGPYPSGYAVKRVFNYLRKIYPFCNCCKEGSPHSLYYHIGLCPGPYQGEISEQRYRENINGIISFLKGKRNDHIKRLEREMVEYAKNEDFEKAAWLRDRVNDLKYVSANIDFTYYDDPLDYQSRRNKAREKSFRNLELDLNIKNLNRIECYDISNIQGKHAYGSMVVSIEGKLSRSQYRIFKIKGKDTPDDPAMLKEVLERRLNNIGKNVDDSLNLKPDVILIDGGKSQLEVVKKYIPKDIYVLGISKGKRLKRSGRRQVDEYWFVRDDQVFQIYIDYPEILIDLRNEAHRFAITHYRKRSIKEAKKSELDNISGIGNKRRKILVKAFGSLEGIKNASIEDLNSVINNEKVSKEIYKQLH